jgi:hypothetical protein
MPTTYNLATKIGQVRLLIPDAKVEQAIFDDAEIGAFLSLEGGSIRKAAALALETIASDHAMTLKVMKVQDISVDGRAVGELLLKKAAMLREQEASGDAAFAIAHLPASTPTEVW